MNDYNYVVYTKEGKKLKGTISALSEDRAKMLLREQGFSVGRVTKQTIWNKDINISIGPAVTARDLSVFCRQFQSLLNAGVTVIDGLEMLSAQTENKTFAQTLKECYAAVQKGTTLADAMKKHPKVFPALLLNMIEAGEASGSLDVSFERMSVYFEKNAKLKALVKKAMIYPIMILIVAFVVLIAMSVIIIPRFSKMFADMGSDLPVITKVVMSFSDFLIHKWYWILLIVGLLALLIGLFARSEKGKLFFGKLAMKLPIFGKLTIKNASALFARTLATLAGAGVPLADALAIVSRSMKNMQFRRALENARAEVIQGKLLNEPLRKCGLFPPMVYQMVRIGEETGNLQGMLEKSAEYYEEEVEMTTANLTTLMEPLIIIVMGVIVGVLVLALYMPMIQMYGTMG